MTLLNQTFSAGNEALPAVIDLDTWRLEVFGTGLRGRPDADHAVHFTYEDLLALPARTITSGLGVVRSAQWTGPLLYDVLELAGITFGAIWLIVEGLDEPVRQRGVDSGRLRGPLPVEKALDDVLVAYGMNGQRLCPDHGFPARLIVPGSEVDSVKWLRRIEVSNRPGISWSAGRDRVASAG